MSQNVTINQMNTMKLFGMAQAYRNLLESAQQQDLHPDELTSLLVQAEWEDRQNKKITRLYTSAKFRYRASVEEIDFTVNRGLDKALMLRLSDMSFIKRKENLLITGATGSGKSFIASALGNQACMNGFKTLYFNATKLFPRLKMLKADGSYMKEINRIEKQDLLVLDDFGLQPLDAQARMALLEIIEDRHGRASTIIASQLPVEKWHETIGDGSVADAILDRIVHSAQRILLSGQSLRKIR
jgi:DNA replication protein DnaC